MLGELLDRHPLRDLTMLLVSFVTGTFAGALIAAINWHRRLVREVDAIDWLEDRTTSLTPPASLRSTAEQKRVTWAGAAVYTLDTTAPEEARSTANAILIHAGADTALYASIIRYCSGSVILIGLLATFIGMSIIVTSLQTQTTGSALSSEIYRFAAAGLQAAFPVTIAGTSASLLTGLVYLALQAEQRNSMSRLTAFLQQRVLPVFRGTSADSIAQIVERTINRTLPQLIAATSTELSAAAANIRTASTAFENAATTTAKALSIHESQHAAQLEALGTVLRATRSLESALQRIEEMRSDVKRLVERADRVMVRWVPPAPSSSQATVERPRTMWESFKAKLGI